MLELNDFVADRGGNPNKIKESQRSRFASEKAVDDVIALYEEARRGKLSSIARVRVIMYRPWLTVMDHAARYEVTQIGSQLNALQKEIGKKKKVGASSIHTSESELIVWLNLEQGRCERFDGTESQSRKPQEKCRGQCP